MIMMMQAIRHEANVGYKMAYRLANSGREEERRAFSPRAIWLYLEHSLKPPSDPEWSHGLISSPYVSLLLISDCQSSLKSD